MTISAIEIELFQPHKLAILHPAKGFTVIIGSSRNGKTSLARAIRWAIENLPRGAEFKSWFAEDSDETRVAMEFEEGTYIMRAKSGKANYYLTSAHDQQLKSLRTDVPDEVSSITRMSSVNIQSQHDPYFMLQPPYSPGEIGRMLNEAVGLEIIDAAIVEVNAVIRKTRSDIDYNRGKLEELEGQLVAFSRLDEVGTLLEYIDATLSMNEELERWIKTASFLIEEISETDYGIKTFDSLLAIEKELPPILSLVESRNKLIDEVERIYQVVEPIELVEENIKKLDILLSIRPKFDEITVLIKDTEKMRSDVSTVKNVLRDIYQLDRRLEDETDALNNKNIELSRLLDEIKICPFCQQPLPDDFHMEEHI